MPRESGELSRLETINVALTPNQPVGSTPGGLGLSADGTKLFVACADANAAAVIDISRRAAWCSVSSRPAGIRPRRSACPTAAWASSTAKGCGSFANPKGPNPLVEVVRDREGIRNDQYVATEQRGTVQFVDFPDEQKLDGYTREVLGELSLSRREA